jgi:hypothetical protein
MSDRSTTTIDPNRYYSLRDAAQCLQVSQPWLRERRREGMAAIEVRGRVWLSGRDIIEFLDSHRTSTPHA